MNDYVKIQRLAGWTPGVHLNAEGQAQAATIAERLEGSGLAAIYSSPLERACETAAPLAARLGLPVQVLDGLGESRCGDWTGQAVEELRKSELWLQVQFYPSGFRYPGGESVAGVQSRMVAAVDALRAAHPGRAIALFSHADPIKLALAFYAGTPLDMYQRLMIAPGSISELEFTSYRPMLVRLNDCAHIPPPPAAPDEPR